MLGGVLRTAGERLSGVLMRGLKARLYASDLDRLAALYGTDKWNSHYYTPHYQRHFGPLRLKRLNILEIGIGEGGPARAPSLRMWQAYFPNSTIHGIDIEDKSAVQGDRIRIYRGSQFDRDFLLDTCSRIGPLDIVIDDGSHVNEHVIFTFNVLFPLLSETGIYAIEDTQTSYWERFGGDGVNLGNPATIMNFFKKLTDGLNHAEIPSPAHVPGPFDETIVALHFYHNLVFVQKGRNTEASNKPHMVGRANPLR